MADGDTPDDQVEESPNTTDTVVEGKVRVRPAKLSGIDRFTILKTLGQGGMGTVYAAYDALLDRKVALKVVRPDRRRKTGSVAPRDQLLREAQAMARLAHPNVVAVHEVGEIGNDIYVVIEFVDGTTLDQWVNERARPWREIVAAYVQAGHGLAAAHAAGLVHRDVKPQNILVRRDGRIQVTDFGVVSMGRGQSGSSDSDSSSSSSGGGSSGGSVRDITYAGHRVGTPNYMAPEQHTGGPVDARADQFSFAVSLWESLYGARPFEGSGEHRLRDIRAGKLVMPATTSVPKYLELVLRRALAANVADRWPSLDDMLVELTRDPARVLRRRLTIGGAAVGVAAIAMLAAIGWTRQANAPAPCANSEDRLAGRWDRERAEAVRAAFAREGRPYERAVGDRIVSSLDSWTKGWVAMRTEACRATRVTGEQSEALLDARMHCLDRQLDEIDQLARALAGVDRAAIARAPQLELPDVSVCADREAVLARVPPPAAPLTRARVVAVEHALALVTTADRAGRFREGRAQASRAAIDAAAIGFQPLVAETMLWRGLLEEQDGDLTAARATLAEAARLGATARDDRVVARALLSLLGVLHDRGEIAGALVLAVATTAAVARTNDTGLEAELEEQLGALHAANGDTEAEVHLKRALALREAADQSSLAVAQVLNRLAGVWLQSGRAGDARAAYERALSIAKTQLGDEHPATSIARANLCFLDSEAGKLAEARACQETVLATLERGLGADHPQVAWALNEVALVQREQGDVAGAEQRFGRALAIWEKASGANHPDVAWPLINLGEIANARGDHARADASCSRARTVLQRDGKDVADALPALACLANARLKRDPRDALAIAKQALELAAGSPDEPAIKELVARCQKAVR